MVFVMTAQRGRDESRPYETKKPADLAISGLLIKPGSVLLSHCLTAAVSSALEGLTSVFEMGTGVTPPAWPPGIRKDCVYQEQIIVKPHGRLVLVGYRPYGPSTSSLSNS